MQSPVNNMVTPYDGAVFGLAFLSSWTLGVISGNSPVVAAIASAIIIGIFGLVAKFGELWWKSRNDKRVADLEAQVRKLTPSA